jgi:hypothetical protein
MMPIGVLMIDPKTGNITYASPEIMKQVDEMEQSTDRFANEKE